MGYTYKNIKEYFGFLPDDLIDLLRAASLFKVGYENGDDETATVVEKWEILPSNTEGGSTNNYTRTITIPLGSGPTAVPMSDLPEALSTVGSDKTFMYYDKEVVLVHELNHAIMSFLAINSEGGSELNIAIMAAAVATANSYYNISTEPVKFAAALKKILSEGDSFYPPEDDFESDYGITNVPIWTKSYKLGIEGPYTSYENRFNIDRVKGSVATLNLCNNDTNSNLF